MNVSLDGANVAGADFTGAVVVNALLANLTAHGFTAGQLYSTASYATGDLRQIRFWRDDVTGWDFRGKSLVRADFTGATGLASARFDSSDLRGAVGMDQVRGHNTILTDGTVEGWDLEAGSATTLYGLTEYAVGTIPAVHVKQGMAIRAGATLVEMFNANGEDGWDSTISFDAGVPVELGGTLLLGAEDGTYFPWLIGRPLRLFDWTGVDPVGRFDDVRSAQAWCQWDTSELYTSGVVRLLAVPEPGTLAAGAVVVVGMAGRRRGRARPVRRGRATG